MTCVHERTRTDDKNQRHKRVRCFCNISVEEMVKRKERKKQRRNKWNNEITIRKLLIFNIYHLLTKELNLHNLYLYLYLYFVELISTLHTVQWQWFRLFRFVFGVYKFVVCVFFSSSISITRNRYFPDSFWIFILTPRG